VVRVSARSTRLANLASDFNPVRDLGARQFGIHNQVVEVRISKLCSAASASVNNGSLDPEPRCLNAYFPTEYLPSTSPLIRFGSDFHTGRIPTARSGELRRFPWTGDALVTERRLPEWSGAGSLQI